MVQNAGRLGELITYDRSQIQSNLWVAASLKRPLPVDTELLLFSHIFETSAKRQTLLGDPHFLAF